MVEEIKKFLEQNKVFFGIKECLRKSKSIDKVIVSGDCREDVKKTLTVNKINFFVSELSRQDISNKLNLNFTCEVFGLTK